ncbi:unnamed protein product, partial [Staurois parvus]
MSHCGPSSSVTRRYGAHGRFGAWHHLWEACNLPATYDKMENSRSVRRPQSGTWQSGSNGVRRPESGTWQSVAMETAAMGGRTGTHERLWTWQQH